MSDRATAIAFTKWGARIVIGDVSDGACEAANLIEADGGNGIFVETDVSSASSVWAFVGATTKTFGGLDIAFNNAGILPQPRHLRT